MELELESTAPEEERVVFFNAVRQAELDRLWGSVRNSRKALYQVIQRVDIDDDEESDDEWGDVDEEALKYDILKEQFHQTFMEDEISRGVEQEMAKLKAEEEAVLQRLNFEYLQFLESTKNTQFDLELDIEAIEKDALQDETSDILQKIAELEKRFLLNDKIMDDDIREVAASEGEHLMGTETDFQTSEILDSTLDLSNVEFVHVQPFTFKEEENKEPQTKCDTKEMDQVKKQRKSKVNVFSRFWRWLGKFNCTKKVEADD